MLTSDTPQRSAPAVFIVWNRRLHFYIGLYLLFFSWLFAFTGLLLNHPKWDVAQFWPRRVQSTVVQEFRPPAGNSDLERARDLMRQLGIVGEIQWPAARQAEGAMAFQVNRPGHIREVKADLRAGRATVLRTETNVWGIMHVLHTFTGTPVNDPSNRRDWRLTTVWALAMDAVGIGLIVMVLSSYIMWFQLKAKRRWGIVMLLLGFASCGVFVAGLRWLI